MVVLYVRFSHFTQDMVIYIHLQVQHGKWYHQWLLVTCSLFNIESTHFTQVVWYKIAAPFIPPPPLPLSEVAGESAESTQGAGLAAEWTRPDYTGNLHPRGETWRNRWSYCIRQRPVRICPRYRGNHWKCDE